ncbi:MAG: hypothetical protein EBV75_02675 [Acidimicrobiia bacterium]|nr:hypothetical protein [Acidimicrobiia bacterium]
MRQLFNLRLWVSLGLLTFGAVIILLVSCDDCFGRGGEPASISVGVEKNIETVAIATTFTQSEGWRIENGRTIGEAAPCVNSSTTIRPTRA